MSKKTPAKRFGSRSYTSYKPSRYGPTSQAKRGELRLLRQPPHVVFTELAWRKVMSFVNLVDTEIGWLGTVRREGDIFTINDVFIAEQKVHGAETEISEAGFNRLQMELLAATADDPVAARAVVDAEEDSEQLGDVMAVLIGEHGCDLNSAIDTGNTIRFWGHSHVNSPVNPSGPDDCAMESFEDNGFTFMLRGIFNKHGDVRIDLFDYERGLLLLDLEFSIAWETVDDVAAIKAEIVKKVKERSQPTSSTRVLHPTAIAAMVAEQDSDGVEMMEEVAAKLAEHGFAFNEHGVPVHIGTNEEDFELEKE